MTRLRLVNYRELSKVVEAAGFHWVRRVGSHNTFRNAEGQIVVVPDHGPRVIGRSLLRKIVRDMRLTVGEYHRILNEM